MAQTMLGIRIGPSQIDRLTRYYGAAIADSLDEPVPTNEPASGVIYAQVDGAMLLTEEGYRVVKLGRIFAASSLKESPVDERGGHITSSLFVAHVGTAVQFSPKFDAQLESHTDRGANLVFISDGGGLAWSDDGKIVAKGYADFGFIPHLGAY
ncbi:hypothetical protein GCM10027423_37000 [Spirosoma arcticum]